VEQLQSGLLTLHNSVASAAHRVFEVLQQAGMLPAVELLERKARMFDQPTHKLNQNKRHVLHSMRVTQTCIYRCFAEATGTPTIL
jgi:hypothetical protein